MSFHVVYLKSPTKFMCYSELLFYSERVMLAAGSRTLCYPGVLLSRDGSSVRSLVRGTAAEHGHDLRPAHPHILSNADFD